MIAQGLRFGLVGLAATAVHMLVGAALILGAMPPLIANGLAFAVAFAVSFTGHFGFTFAESGARFAVALRRFAVVALGGFAVNEALLILLLGSMQGAWPTTALVTSTSVAAGLTFLASRFWAFQPPAGGRDRFSR